MRYDCRTHVSKLAAQTVTVRHQTKSLIAPLRSIERKKKDQTWGPVNIYRWRGGGVKEDLRGGSQSFQEEQKEDQTSPTEYKVQDNCR